MVLPLHKLKIVTPGEVSEPQWTRWFGRYTALAQYPDALTTWQEWKLGIWVKGANRRTVPLEDLEKAFWLNSSAEQAWWKGEHCKLLSKALLLVVYAQRQAWDHPDSQA